MFPGNIEILLNDSIFLNNNSFSYRLSADTERDRALSTIIEDLWAKYDTDNSGALDRNETRKLLQEAAIKCPPPNNEYDESKFE